EPWRFSTPSGVSKYEVEKYLNHKVCQILPSSSGPSLRGLHPALLVRVIRVQRCGDRDPPGAIRQGHHLVGVPLLADWRALRVQVDQLEMPHPDAGHLNLCNDIAGAHAI